MCTMLCYNSHQVLFELGNVGDAQLENHFTGESQS